MTKLKDYENFLNEEELLEGTIEGYNYRFKFEDKKYIIRQSNKDKNMFGIKNKDGGWFVMTNGHLFDPAHHDMDRNSMVELLQRGIKYFNVRNPVEPKDVKESEWAKFFKFELNKKPGKISKKYVVLKLHCGKAAAKWLSR